ncbi:MAG: quinohemoprotein amine dehydrogenase maturation protein [Longimicrobiales bacterium]
MSGLGRGEYHRFESVGAPYAYMVPSAAIFRLDDAAAAVLDALEDRVLTVDELHASLDARFGDQQVRDTIAELLGIRAIRSVHEPIRPVRVETPRRIPLTTLVLNVTSKCNLACTYCYEYGEDRIVPDTGKPRFMDEATARKSVDLMFAESGDNRVVHLTFFGGETLLNFKVLKPTLQYARDRAVTLGKEVDASLTTNATLLKSEVIDWLVENNVGVTVSIDGGREQQDRFRVFNNGMGSYDIVLPKIRELLARHRSRPIGARVTLTRQNLDVLGIYRHLTDEIGFSEIGFAPVTTSANRDHAIRDEGFDRMLAQFQQLAYDFLAATLANRHHGFSNVKDTLEEIHKGMSKAYPCGAGLGLVGVATDGDVALCHRFAGSDEHRIGNVDRGIDRDRQEAFLQQHHIAHKTDCSTCWARPICAGGCYHEAHTRYGTTTSPNLHYCDWIRSWTDTCLRVYATLAEQKPEILARFDA